MSSNFDKLSQAQHDISLADAAKMTRLFRDNFDNMLQPVYQGQNILPFCETFNRNIFDALLAQPSCAGLRIYYGMSEDLKVHAILVGVDASGADVLPATGSTVIGEVGIPCPPVCPTKSLLNGF